MQLRGSPKQIAWAEEIKRQHLQELEYMSAELLKWDDKQKTRFADEIILFKKFVIQIENETSAKFFIETRRGIIDAYPYDASVKFRLCLDLLYSAYSRRMLNKSFAVDYEYLDLLKVENSKREQQGQKLLNLKEFKKMLGLDTASIKLMIAEISELDRAGAGWKIKNDSERARVREIIDKTRSVQNTDV